MFTDGLRRFMVPGVFGAVILSVWGVAALKADLEGPLPTHIRVDPAIVEAAVMAAEGDSSFEAMATSNDASYIFLQLAS